MSPQPIRLLQEVENSTNYSPYGSPRKAAGGRAVSASFGIVASLTFLIWDILITMDDEVAVIWPRSWNYTKCVYFLVRYFPVVLQIPLLFVGSELSPSNWTQDDCFIWEIYQGVASCSIILVVDTILILRVYALYNGNRTIHYIVSFFFFAEIVCMAVGLGLALPGITYSNICLVTAVPTTLLIYGGGSITFQTVLFILTVIKFVQAVRSGWGDVPLIKLLMRDGTWAFFLLFCVYVGQVGLYSLGDSVHAYSGLLFGWMLSLFSFCGYRILLNLSKLGDVTGNAKLNHHGGVTRQTDTNIQFTTRVFDTERFTDGRFTDNSGAEESYELVSREKSKHAEKSTTTQISTLELGR